MRRIIPLLMAVLCLLTVYPASAESINDEYSIHYDNGTAHLPYHFTDVQAQVLLNGQPAPAGKYDERRVRPCTESLHHGTRISSAISKPRKITVCHRFLRIPIRCAIDEQEQKEVKLLWA